MIYDENWCWQGLEYVSEMAQYFDDNWVAHREIHVVIFCRLFYSSMWKNNPIKLKENYVSAFMTFLEIIAVWLELKINVLRDSPRLKKT